MPFVGAVYLLAFLSGSSALIYEVAWTKQLALTFGRTTLAASAVLGGFMAGMGIGAWLCHRGLRVSRDPLSVYALLEVGIGVSAALLTAGSACYLPSSHCSRRRSPRALRSISFARFSC